MPDTAAHEKSKPTDDDLRNELEALTAKRARMLAGISEIDARISELKKSLKVKGD